MYIVLQFPSVVEAEILRDELNASYRTAESNSNEARMDVLGDAADRIDQVIREQD